MATNRAELERIANTPAAPVPTHIGQGTAVEQSRAVAEVQAAVVVAQQRPRNTTLALNEMRDSCRNKRLAERAFFKFRRGTSSIAGPTVHLARELARCWGNVQYGLQELRRNDAEGYSEMQAWAWDLQTNTRVSNTFVVPHMRDKTGGPERLTDMRDIYENNTNNGSRRVRQAIFAILPPWFTEEAQDLCNATLADGGGKSLRQRVADAVRMFEGVGVTADQLEEKVGQPSGKWTEHDVAALGVTFRSLQRGEITKDEEFPPRRTTAADITAPPSSHPAPVPTGPLADAADEYGEEDWPEPTAPGVGGAA